MKILLLYTLLFSPLASFSADPITTGDQLFWDMKYVEAIAQYQQVPTNAEAEWKMARAYICLGDISSAEKKKQHYYKAVDAARRCLKLSDSNSNGHTWLGAGLGNIAMYEGSRTKIKLCTEIKQEVERAIALNPKDDIAFSILGSFYRELGNISWFERTLANAFLGSLPKGGYAESEIAFKKAIALSPKVIRHWYELGILYRYLGKNQLAKQAFQTAQELPVQLASDRTRLELIKKALTEN